jgi:outer membrane lipoprotein-sorting protein
MYVKKVFLSVGLVFLFCSQTSAQSVEEIIGKNIQMQGGMEKLKSVQSIKMTGKISGGKNGLVSFVLQKKRPNLLRIDSLYRGKKSALGYDGKVGWEADLMETTPHLATGSLLQELQEEADFDGPLVDYKEKGITVELIGKEDVNGVSTYRLKLTFADGAVTDVFLNAANGQQLKKTTRTKVQGREAELDCFYRNYKQVDGLTLPFSIETRTNGRLDQQTTIDSVHLNAEVNDSVFQMPRTWQ